MTDDGFVWHKTCEQCTAASVWLEQVCEGWVFERRQEDFESHVLGDERDLRTRSLTRLLRWMRADWRNRAGELRPLGDVMVLTAAAIREHRELIGAH